MVRTDNLLQNLELDLLVFKRSWLKIKSVAQFADTLLDTIQYGARPQTY